MHGIDAGRRFWPRPIINRSRYFRVDSVVPSPMHLPHEQLGGNEHVPSLGDPGRIHIFFPNVSSRVRSILYIRLAMNVQCNEFEVWVRALARIEWNGVVQPTSFSSILSFNSLVNCSMESCRTGSRVWWSQPRLGDSTIVCVYKAGTTFSIIQYWVPR